MSQIEATPDRVPSPAQAAGRTAVRLPAWSCLVLAAALLILRQPYTGVRHDAVLYLGQSLARLDPAWARHDFYFQFGSQDSFSFFSRLFTWPVEIFGIAPAEIGALLILRTLSLWAVYLLAKDLPPLRRGLAVLAVACLSHYFGTARIFSTLEPFITARSAAEPLAIFGFAALVRGRITLAAAAMLAAMACHPLVAVPAVLVAWAYLISVDRRWSWAGALALPILGLAIANVAPFDRLLAIYDEQWFAVIANINADVFLTLWNHSDFVAAAMDLGIVWIATRGDTRPLARLGRAAVVSCLVLGLVSVIAADFVHDVLVTQLQLWRVLWIGNLLAAVWLPGLVLNLWRRDSTGRLAALAIATAVFGVSDWAAGGWALALWALVAWLLSERRVVLKPGVVRLAIGATLLVAVAQAGQSTWSLLYQIAMERHGTAIVHAASIPFTLPLLTIPVAGWVLWKLQQDEHRILASAGILALAVLALAQFDQRSAFVKFEEGAAPSQRPFQDLIPTSATVYWEHVQLAPVWLLLRRAAFAQEGQFSGLLFNRGTAKVGMERLPLVAPAIQQVNKCQSLEGWTQAGYHFKDCDEAESVLHAVCTAKRGHADFFVTQAQYRHPPLAAWRFDANDGSAPVTYYLHDCGTVH